MDRFQGSEITLSRIADAFRRRVKSLPHRIAWSGWNDRYRNNRERLLRFRNIHQGERCFIIGNGPSLAKMDLMPLRHEYTFGMNRIYLLFEKLGFETSYYVSTNELVIQQYLADIKELKMPKFINWHSRHLFDRTDEDVIFLNLRLELWDKFSTDLTGMLSSGATVTFAALQIAYWMGFKQAILIGVDHNFVEKGTPNKTEVRAEEEDQSHFAPNYFEKGVKWQLPDLRRSEVAYQLAKNAYEADGKTILDATLNGKLEIFEKVDYKELLA